MTNPKSSNAWGKLWEMATSGEEAPPATITPDPYDCGNVLLVWPDGSKAGLYWHDGDWHFSEELDTCPCDVSARDTL